MNKDPYYRLSSIRLLTVGSILYLIYIFARSTPVQYGFYRWIDAPGSRDPGARKDILPVARASPYTSTCSVLGRTLDRRSVLRDLRSIPAILNHLLNTRTRARITVSI